MKGIGEGSDLQKVHYRQCGRGELSPFCNKISPVVYISRPVASGGQMEKLRARAKIPVWEKMEGVCVKTGLEKNRYEENGQIHSGDLIC